MQIPFFNIWTLATILSRVEPLWEIVCNVPLSTSEWHGWLLVYLTRNCFNLACQNRQGKNDPFRYKYISTVEKILQKVVWSTMLDLKAYLNGFSDVMYYAFDRDINETPLNFVNAKNGDDINVIIIDRISHDQSNIMDEIVNLMRPNSNSVLLLVSDH